MAMTSLTISCSENHSAKLHVLYMLEAMGPQSLADRCPLEPFSSCCNYTEITNLSLRILIEAFFMIINGKKHRYIFYSTILWEPSCTLQKIEMLLISN